MIRYARADGSEGSNKRTYEEATSWEEVKADLQETRKKQKEDKGKKIQKGAKGKKIQKGDKGKKIQKGAKGKKIQKGAKGKKIQKDAEISHEKGQTNPTQKIKEKGKKRKPDNLDNQHTPVDNVSRKTKKEEEEKKMSLKERKKNFIIEGGKKCKVLKKGIKKPLFDLHYEEDETMPKYKNFFVKHEAVLEIEELKKSLKEKNLDVRQINNKVLLMERKADNQLYLELMREQIKQMNVDKMKESIINQRTDGNTNPDLTPDEQKQARITKNMTRYARADGSKGSNKRTYEEATSWEEVKADLQETRKKQKEDKGKKIQKGAKGKKIQKGDKGKKIQKGAKGKKIQKGAKGKKIQKDAEISHEKGQTNPTQKIKEKGKKRKPDNLDNQHTPVDNVSRKTKKEEEEKKMSLKERKKNFIIEGGKKCKVLKKGIKKPLFDLHYEEDETMPKYKNFFVKHEAVLEIEELKKSLKEKNLDVRQINNEVQLMERKSDNQLRLELMREQIKQMNVDKTKESIINQRTDGNTNPDLTPDEQKQARKERSTVKENSGRISLSRNQEMNMIKFGGFNIKKEGAERLNKLREQMTVNGCTEDEILTALQEERLKEEKILKQEKRNSCFRCMGFGHKVSMCPQNIKDGVEVCYKCGFAGHMARECHDKKGSFFHATCFICGEVGHISRECPDNPLGATIPMKDAEMNAISVEHLKKDCPDLQKKFADDTIKVAPFRPGLEVEDLDLDET